MVNGRRPTLTDFKEYCHLEKDGQALYEAIQKGIINGIDASQALAVLKESGVTPEMGRDEILEKLKKALGDDSEESPVAKLAKEESAKLRKVYASEKYESGLRSIKASQDGLKDRIEEALKQAKDGAAIAYRAQIEKVIEVLIEKWE